MLCAKVAIMSLYRGFAMLTMRTALTGLMALMLAVPAAAQFSDTYNFFKHVRERKAFEAVKIITEAGSTVVNFRDPETGDTALVMVTRGRDLGWVNLLISKGADVNGKARDGNPPLTVAANLGWSDGVQRLLSVGANINAQNSSGETALIKAVQAHDLATVRILVDAGANADKSDSVAGKSARDYALDDRRYSAIAKIINDGPTKPESLPSTLSAPK